MLTNENETKKAEQESADSAKGKFVGLREEHNKFILNLQKNKEKVQQNIERLKFLSNGIEQSAKKVSSDITAYYNELIVILSNLQKKRLNELEAIKNKKMAKIKQASIASNEALKFLAKSEDDFKRILGDKKMQITAKHIAMSQYIENTQNALKKHSVYFDDNVQIPTSEKIEYAMKNKQVFEDFVEGMDEVIDCSIGLGKLRPVKNEIVMDWKSDLQNNENADCEWKSCEKLKVKSENKRTKKRKLKKRSKRKKAKQNDDHIDFHSFDLEEIWSKFPVDEEEPTRHKYGAAIDLVAAMENNEYLKENCDISYVFHLKQQN